MKKTLENVNEPVYLVRMNYFEKDANDPTKLAGYLYKNNLVSINVKNRNDIKDEKSKDDIYFDKLLRGEIKKQDPKKNYIGRFCSLINDVKKSDVIVVASYLGKFKIGLIEKDSAHLPKEESDDIYKLYYFEMKNVKDVDIVKFPILRSMIPAQATISPVKKRKNVIYSIYHDREIPIKLSSMSESAIEIMCAEFLRSDKVPELIRPKSIKVGFQMTKIGGNYPDVDIIGYNFENEEIVAQVSDTKDTKMIEKKKIKLREKYKNAHKVMFSSSPSCTVDEIINININDVWNYFSLIEYYKLNLERLIKL